MNKAISLLKEYVKDSDTVVIAASAGPDSMCLLNIIIDLKKEFNLNVIVAHVNHKLRKEADEEALFVKAVSKNNNLIFESIDLSDINCKSESYYRLKRYEFFKKMVNKYNAKFLLTAHHGDDLIETILMRIVRGSNLNGYIGIKAIDKQDNYLVLRPLIFYNKNDIIKYNKKMNITYYNDASNDTDLYTRNRYRHHVLPFLKSENNHVNERFRKFSVDIENACNFINRSIEAVRGSIFCDNKLVIDKFKKIDEYLQEKIVEEMLLKIYKEELYHVGLKNVHQIITFICNTKVSNAKIDLPLSYVGVKSYNYFYITEKNDSETYKIELSKEVNISGYGRIYCTDTLSDTSNYTIRLSSKEIKLPLYIRNRKNGDRIAIKNLNGTKKIKDIFIDEKIIYEKRANYPLLVDSLDKILWIPGIKKSKFDKEKKENYDIIVKYEKENVYEQEK